MKLSKINFESLAVILILAIAAALPFVARAEADYSACANLNDFLSYSKCVAEIDSKKNGQTVALPDDTKAKDGDFSIKIGDGSGKVYSPSVTLYFTASADTAKVAISKDSNFGFADRQAYSAKKVWLLENTPDETQYVYAKFFDANDAELKTVAAAVIYSSRKVNAAAETAAKAAFAKIYGKKFNSQNQFDNAWLETAAYGLDKNTERDTDKEKVSAAKFKTVYKRAAKGTAELRYVDAITYTPEPDTSATTDTSSPSAEISTPAAGNPACVAAPIKQILDVGSKGAAVKSLQELLKCDSYLTEDFKVDGTFNKETEDAVKKFQEKYNLSCANGTFCGRVGPATAKKLMEVYKEGQAETQTAPVAETPAPVKLKFTRNLTIGVKGKDVEALQKYLAQDSELYPDGKVSGTFDEATEEAIKKFQEKNNLTCKDGTACGYVGPATRQKLQEASAQ